MNYRYHPATKSRRSFPRRGGSTVSKILVFVIAVLCIVLVIVGAYFFFRSPEPDVVAGVIVQADGAFEGIVTEVDAEAASEVVSQTSDGFEEVSVYALHATQSLGVARRHADESTYTFALVVTLPALDDLHQYEVWLATRGITQYIPAGVMSRRSDGKFALVFEKTDEQSEIDKLNQYSQVVITREVRDQDTSPSIHHVARATF